MKKSIKTVVVGLLAVSALLLGVGFAQPAFASDISNGAAAAQGNNNTTCLFSGQAGCTTGVFTTIVNTALFIIGALSVVMLIFGGIRYTISMGDAKNVTAAKNTIMYAIIGIVVAMLAFAIVNFVIGKLGA